MPFWMRSWILVHWTSFTTGPIWRPSWEAGPTVTLPATAAASSTAASYLPRCTSIRLGALQLWPVLFIMCRTPRLTALSSASSKMTLAPLPPSSRCTRFSVSAAFFEIRRPARDEPVKLTMSTSLCPDRAVPTPGPSPFTRLKTPAGKPASSIISAKIMALCGDSSDGFRTMVQPAMAAAPTLSVTWFIGQFQGVMRAATPTAS
mmetsp:Transcript_28626/g.53917  ORF Transcript_28626/g.53917 Transcript_28626/m.53917 type:complete len:204 (-) Transcript_28626:452-1063(-)